MKLAYADPPYPGMSHYYRDHPDYAGEVDHAALFRRLEAEYDGWLLHTASTTLLGLAPHVPEGARIMAWVKPFAAFKRNVPCAYAWEPVLVKPARKQVVSGRIVLRDWVSCPIAMERGLVGAKPPEVIRWGFEVLGAEPDDTLEDLFPGTGIVGRTWNEWVRSMRFLAPPA